MRLSGQFLRFSIIGTAGYFVDVSVLYLMHYLGMDLYSARIISFIVAATSTWIGNRLFTFKRSKSSRKKLASEWASYIAAMSLGGVANYATYALLITYLTIFREHLWLAVAAATSVGMLINFVLARRILYSSDA
jgi:putative flippase GtrA